MPPGTAKCSSSDRLGYEACVLLGGLGSRGRGVPHSSTVDGADGWGSTMGTPLLESCRAHILGVLLQVTTCRLPEGTRSSPWAGKACAARCKEWGGGWGHGEQAETALQRMPQAGHCSLPTGLPAVSALLLPLLVLPQPAEGRQLHSQSLLPTTGHWHQLGTSAFFFSSALILACCKSVSSSLSSSARGKTDLSN